MSFIKKKEVRGFEENLAREGDYLKYYERVDVDVSGEEIHYYRVHYIPDKSKPTEEFFRFNYDMEKGPHFHRKLKGKPVEEDVSDEVTVEEAKQRILEAEGDVSKIKTSTTMKKSRSNSEALIKV